MTKAARLMAETNAVLLLLLVYIVQIVWFVLNDVLYHQLLFTINTWTSLSQQPACSVDICMSAACSGHSLLAVCNDCSSGLGHHLG